MKKKIVLPVAAVALVLAAIWLMRGSNVDETELANLDLPWQVTPHEDGTSTVFGLRLGEATLADAIARFGEPEGIALFLREDDQRSLESYFGTVRFGPFEAKVVTTLVADDWLLDGLAIRAIGRDRTRSGDRKLLIPDADKAPLTSRPLKGITYIPTYSGLEPDFFRERIGEPAASRQENEHAVSWFYPRLGLFLLIDDKGKEVFEFVPPADFAMPADAVPAAL